MMGAIIVSTCADHMGRGPGTRFLTNFVLLLVFRVSFHSRSLALGWAASGWYGFSRDSKSSSATEYVPIDDLGICQYSHGL
jgi:hypothetical protein